MFSQLPDTRPSILQRVGDSSDDDAWATFESVYRPAIYRFAKHSGLQDADADDVAQSVLARLAGRSWRFTPADDGAKFRTWLATVTRNHVVDHIRAQSRVTELSSELDAFSTDSNHRDGQLELEYRREVFQWAARLVRKEFSSEAWQSFWLTAVENRSVEEAARLLDRSVGSVYTSRSRVMRRLKLQISRFDDGLGEEL